QVKLCESLVGLGLSTSKRGGYQVPLEKSFAGIFAPFSPSGRAS
ncbi:aspartate/glutamate racemase family protein, partial [Mesorhizobium sp. M5C.F.Ca.IN.020.32.2.1]